MYVAFSRAKYNLNILSNHQELFELCHCDDITISHYQNHQTSPRHLALYLNHRDVNLGSFQQVQKIIKDLNSGDHLSANQNGIFIITDTYFIFQKHLKVIYKIISIMAMSLPTVKLILLYFGMIKKTQQEYKIILPILYLNKQTN